MHHKLFPVSTMCLLILLLIFLLKNLELPYLIAYVIAGLVLILCNRCFRSWKYASPEKRAFLLIFPRCKN